MNTKKQPQQNEPIGYIVGGGLEASLRARLTVPPEEVQEGAFVVVQHGNWKFYGIVTDLELGATDPRFADEASAQRLHPQLAEALHGQTLFTTLKILPQLMQDMGPEPGTPAYRAWVQEHPEPPTPQPIKTVPRHHAPVALASALDIDAIFSGNFVVGYTREQGHPVSINLDKFVQRSTGIFGATGTGKSFLTRMILAGLIHHNAASVLVFDMHNEYGLDDVATDTNQPITGLKSKFRAQVQIVGLGPQAMIRGHAPDFNLVIPSELIQPGDILMLSRELNLTDTAGTVLDALWHSFHKQWFARFRAMTTDTITEVDEITGKKKTIPAPGSVAAWADENNVHPKAAESLHSKLGQLFHRDYIMDTPPQDSVTEIINTLSGKRHVVLSFGKYEGDLDYLFVSNLLTRELRHRWEAMTNHYRSQGGMEPRHLIIVVEEAHKLLNDQMAKQTAFATIARELRKYYVTLLIIDQRPSQIYDEVMSQLGTRICGWLGDDNDISAVLSGLSGRGALRGMLAHLQPKEEVLLLGWGIPLPMPIRSRRYDQTFWQELLGKNRSSSTKEKLAALGFGDDDD